MDKNQATLANNPLALASIVEAPGIANDENLGILDSFKKFVPDDLKEKVKIWPQRLATVKIGPLNAKHSLLVVAHADTNGLRVSKITDDGFLRFQTVGGVSSAHYLSQVVSVWIRTKRGFFTKIHGVVGWKALHNLEAGERNQAPDPKNLAIDIGAKDKAQAEELGIRMGDPVTFDSKITYLKNGLLAANGLDNRAGVWSLIDTLCKTYKEKLGLRVVFAISGKEEIGLVGAQQISGLHRNFDFCIGMDVGFANDYPGDTGLKSTGPEISLGRGPIIYRGSAWDRELVECAIDLARIKEIPCQLEFAGGGLGTDAATFHVKGVRTIHLGIPCRYMHFKEVASFLDFQNTSELAAELIKKIPSMGSS